MNQREKVFNKSGGKCFYCGIDLAKGWHQDHFHPILRESILVENNQAQKEKTGFSHRSSITGNSSYPELDTIDNLVPSCAPCNLYKSSYSIEGFRSAIENSFKSTLKASSSLRQLDRLKLIDLSEKPVVFYFESAGLTVKSRSELMGFSNDSDSINWTFDNIETCHYTSIGSYMLTVRSVGTMFLTILTECGSWVQERFEVDCRDINDAKRKSYDLAIERINLEGEIK